MNPINDDTKFYKCNKKKACNVSTQCGNLCTITQDEEFAVDLDKFVTYADIKKDLAAAQVKSKEEAQIFNEAFTNAILKFDSDLEKEVAKNDNANIIN